MERMRGPGRTGLNQYGQLGVGDAADRHSPVAMNTSALGDARVTAVSPSYYHTALIAGMLLQRFDVGTLLDV